MDPGARLRLLIAVLASCGVHLSLLYTVEWAPPQPGTTPIALQVRVQQDDPAAGARRAQQRMTHAAESTRSASRRDRVEAPTRTRGEAPTASAQTHVAAPAPAPALELPPVPDPTWYPARHLDVFPRAVTPLQPVYPEQSGAGPVRGEVTLLLLIDEAGALHEVSVVEAQPEGVFEGAATAAFAGARFVPARKDGHAVRSRILVKIGFSPDPPVHADPGAGGLLQASGVR